MQNGCIESFNGKLRAEVLTSIGSETSEVKEIIEDRLEYNNIRPHMSLDNLTPAEYALMISGGSTF